MKKQDITETKRKTSAELTAMLADHRERLRRMKFDLAAGKVKNIGALRMIKKDIARILTFRHTADRAPVAKQ